jgi:hypothetical protein
MCMRVPLVITEELLQDLTSYKKDRDRGVRMAARSLIGLFRELAPGMLVKKDRGKGADSSRTLLQFGHVRAARTLSRLSRPETVSCKGGATSTCAHDHNAGMRVHNALSRALCVLETGHFDESGTTRKRL